jgi:APA family basic amino acid/polyamine antiporter
MQPIPEQVTLKPEQQKLPVKLKRNVTFVGILSAGIGAILGAGIYALIGKAALVSGNMLWLSFLIAAVIAVFTGLSFAELSSKMPKAGGAYYYVSRIVSKKIGNVVGFGMILVGIFVSATLAKAFSGYLSSFISANMYLVAISLLILIALINYFGVDLSIRFNIVATVIETLGLIIIILLGLRYFGAVNYLEQAPAGFAGVFAAVGIIFFAYLGFEDIVNIAEETKKARQMMPRAVVLSLIITTVLYVLVAFSVVSIASYQELGSSDSPLTFVFKQATGLGAGNLFSVVALFSIFNTVLLIFMATTRIAYSMGRSKVLPEIFGMLHEARRTPYFSILVIGLFAVSAMFIGDISVLAQLSDIMILAVFLVVNFAVICLRYKHPRMKGFSVPFSIGRFPIIPLLGILSSLVILIITFLNVVKVI